MTFEQILILLQDGQITAEDFTTLAGFGVISGVTEEGLATLVNQNAISVGQAGQISRSTEVISRPPEITLMGGTVIRPKESNTLKFLKSVFGIGGDDFDRETTAGAEELANQLDRFPEEEQGFIRELIANAGSGDPEAVQRLLTNAPFNILGTGQGAPPGLPGEPGFGITGGASDTTSDALTQAIQSVGAVDPQTGAIARPSGLPGLPPVDAGGEQEGVEVVRINDPQLGVLTFFKTTTKRTDESGAAVFDVTFSSPLTEQDIAAAQTKPGGIKEVQVSIGGRDAVMLINEQTGVPLPGSAGGPFFDKTEADRTAEGLQAAFDQVALDTAEAELNLIGLQTQGFEEDRAAALAFTEAQTADIRAGTAATLRQAFSTPAQRLRSLVSRGRELGLDEISAELLASSGTGEGFADFASLLSRTGTPPSSLDVDLSALNQSGFQLPVSFTDIFPELAGGDIPLDAAGLAGAIPTGQFQAALSPAERDLFAATATEVFGVDLRELEEAQNRLRPTAGAASTITGALRA